jgi:IS66 C-terminal element
MRVIALSRKNYLFVGSPSGGKSAAIAYTLIETAKLNGVDPQAWLTDTLARIPDQKSTAAMEHAVTAVRPNAYLQTGNALKKRPNSVKTSAVATSSAILTDCVEQTLHFQWFGGNSRLTGPQTLRQTHSR